MEILQSTLTNMDEKYRVGRHTHLAETVVVVDGLPGCGKTMMSPIVSGFPRVELVQYSYQLEYVCSLRYLKKIDSDVATTLIRLFTDQQLYNVMMSRETNFRWDDISGVRFNPNRWKYIRRLFQPGDADVIGRIEKERPILHLVTHLMLCASSSLFAALGERLRFVEVVRHPLYMLKQQFKIMDRMGTDARDFNVWREYDNQMLPWWISGWEDKFLASNPMDRAIYMNEQMQRQHQLLAATLSESQRNQLLIIPFERFVTDPWPYMAKLEKLLGTTINSITRRALKSQNVPRKMYAEGIALPIYKEYGWEPPKKGSDEEKEFERRRQFAAESATPAAMEVLDRLCYQYEQEYLL